MSLIRKVIKDCSTNQTGEEFDPARVIGYAVVVLASFAFIVMSVYDTFVNKKFDYTGFAAGLGGVGVSLAAAAAGVWMKKDTENKPKVE